VEAAYTSGLRVVTHVDVDRAGCEQALEAISRIIRQAVPVA